MEHCAPHTRAVHTATCLERKVAGRENCFSTLKFFQAVVTGVVVERSQPLAAKSMSPRKQKEATTSSLSSPTWTSLCCLPSKGVMFPFTTYTCNQGPLSSA